MVAGEPLRRVGRGRAYTALDVLMFKPDFRTEHRKSRTDSFDT